jgi:outer membrane protein assembly factor BamB
MRTKGNVLYVGIGSHVVAIRPSDGQEIWRTKLKMTSFVTVYADGDTVYAGAGGELFCLDATTGAVRWRNKLKGLGSGLIAFSGASTVDAAAAMAAAMAAAQVAAAGAVVATTAAS